MTGNALYTFTLEIASAAKRLPAGTTGALVACYVGATDPDAAMKRVVSVLEGGGYAVVDAPGTTKEIPTDLWGFYVQRTWPEFLDRLPSRETIGETVASGEAFFGPFIGFSD